MTAPGLDARLAAIRALCMDGDHRWDNVACEDVLRLIDPDDPVLARPFVERPGLDPDNLTARLAKAADNPASLPKAHVAALLREASAALPALLDAVDALRDVVVGCYEYGAQDGDFVASYVMPTGPIHRAIPLLQERFGIVARPRSQDVMPPALAERVRLASVAACGHGDRVGISEDGDDMSIVYCPMED